MTLNSKITDPNNRETSLVLQHPSGKVVKTICFTLSTKQLKQYVLQIGRPNLLKKQADLTTETVEQKCAVL